MNVIHNHSPYWYLPLFKYWYNCFTSFSVGEVTPPLDVLLPNHQQVIGQLYHLITSTVCLHQFGQTKVQLNACIGCAVCNYISVFIGYCYYIVLYILYVVIFFAVICETESVAFVIPQRQNLSGVLLKPLRAWDYPNSCLLSPKGDACPDEIGFNSRLKISRCHLKPLLSLIILA